MTTKITGSLGKPRRSIRGSTKRSPKHLKKPELKWMDRFLRSLQDVAPVESIPAQYLPMLRHSTKGLTRNLH